MCILPRHLTEFFSQPFVSRYSELEHFHRQMICRFPELKTESAFPRKRFWGNFSPYVLKTRADQFCSYFHHLLNARNCIYRQSAIFRDFFISTQERALSALLKTCQYRFISYSYSEVPIKAIKVSTVFIRSRLWICAKLLVPSTRLSRMSWNHLPRSTRYWNKRLSTLTSIFQ